MPRAPEGSRLVLEPHTTIAEIETEWRKLEGARECPGLSFEWLHALEKTRCAVPSRGWAPHHLLLKTENGELIAGAPAYVKSGSEGEFVFDFAWANAAAKFGVEYYPKLVVAVPFTPATGARVLTAPGADRALAQRAIAEGLVQITKALDISSAHVLFPTEAEANALAGVGLAHRVGVQYQWHNRGYTSFEDFLKSLPQKRRTQIRRERKALTEQGIVIETVAGADADASLIDVMFDFYVSTVEKFYWGRQYLTRAFFDEVFSTMGPSLEIVVARDASRKPIAGALNLRGDRVLFGRYWGTSVDVPFLHFNVCYYHSVEACIERKLDRFEPGAGGEHKVARGFDPTATHSVHYIRNARFRAAIADFVDRERLAVLSELSLDAAASS